MNISPTFQPLPNSAAYGIPNQTLSPYQPASTPQYTYALPFYPNNAYDQMLFSTYGMQPLAYQPLLTPMTMMTPQQTFAPCVSPNTLNAQFIPAQELNNCPSPTYLLPQNNLGCKTPLFSTTASPTNSTSGVSFVSSASSDNQDEGYKALKRTTVASQKTDINEFHKRYGYGLVEAFRKAADARSDLDLTFHLQENKKKPKSSKSSVDFEITWYCNTTSLEFQILKQRTERNDFENTLTCEMAKIDNGSFNKYVDGAKQLTIINMGYRCAQRLGHVLTNRNGELAELLSTPEEDRFSERCMSMLYRVSEDKKGNALRGKTVVGLRFKQQPDILRMDEFLERVLQTVQITRATMIASLKKNRQYKGWSLYLDVGNEESTKAVLAICDEFGFRRKPNQSFIALDRHTED